MSATLFIFPKIAFVSGTVVLPKNPVGFYVEAEGGYYSGDCFFVFSSSCHPPLGHWVRLRYEREKRKILSWELRRGRKEQVT